VATMTTTARPRHQRAWAADLVGRFTGPAAAAGRWSTPADLAAEMDPRFRRTPAIDLINEQIVKAINTPDSRLIISMPPQEGKSTVCTKWTPVWLLAKRPDTRVVIASYAHDVARRMGRLIRSEIEGHSPQLGIRVNGNVSAQHEWEIAGHRGGIFAVGIGGGLTSRPADVMLIDDPLKDRAQADSKVYRDAAWDWWTDVASTRLSPGAPVILILTRWHEDDLAGRLLAAEDGHRWTVVNIPAQADHKPELGETDPLGRQPGEFMESARGRTLKQWLQRKVAVGARTWASLFQGRPTPEAGDIFKAEDFDGGPDQPRRYHAPLWVERADGSRWVPGVDDTEGVEMLQTWDLTFKDTDASDYVVGQVWLRRGIDCYLLDQVRGRWDFPATVREFRDLTAVWPQALLKLVEDKANGPAVIAALRHSVPGIVPEEPQGSKVARARAISPLVEAGNVHLPTAKLAPWVAGLVTEATGFPYGAHDDQVDALSQGLNRLVLQPLLTGGALEIVDQDDLLDDEDDEMAYLV